jgi:hypothetical protein
MAIDRSQRTARHQPQTFADRAIDEALLVGVVYSVRKHDMRETGFEPAVVVETSPNNFQVWLNHGRVLSDQFLSTLVARQLSLRFRGDRGSCDWRHFGRLAGFTNQKRERRLDNGLQPFVKLRCRKGQVYFGAAEFLRQVEVLKRAIISKRESGKRAQSRSTDTPVSPLISFYYDPRTRP